MYSILLQSTPLQISEAPAEILQIKNHVCAGFPSPAEDLGAQRIDLASPWLMQNDGKNRFENCVWGALRRVICAADGNDIRAEIKNVEQM